MDAMYADEFYFYRGANQIFYNDAKGVVDGMTSFASARTWIQGDMHCQNLGVFGDDSGNVVFDLNDFDEAFVSNHLYDIYRFATSLVIVSRIEGYSAGQWDNFVKDFARAYLEQLEAFNSNNDENSWTLKKCGSSATDSFCAQEPLRSLIGAMEDRDGGSKDAREEMLDKWSTKVDGPAGEGKVRAFKSDEPKIEPVRPKTSAEYTGVEAAVAAYCASTAQGCPSGDSYFKVWDIGRRLLAGTGSRGSLRYYVVIEGATGDPDDDVILDVKHQQQPTVQSYPSSGPTATSTDEDNVEARVNGGQSTSLSYGNTGEDELHARRVAQASKDMLDNADDHIGVLSYDGKWFSVRERSPYKASVETFPAESGFDELCEDYGRVVAAFHARGDQATSFESVMHPLTNSASEKDEYYCDTWNFAREYEKQVNQDYVYFKELVDADQICTM